MSLEKSPDDEAAEQAAAWRRWRDADIRNAAGAGTAETTIEAVQRLYQRASRCVLGVVYHEVHGERADQDEKWGGPEHDDEHAEADWLDYIYGKIVAVPERFRSHALRGAYPNIGLLYDATPQVVAASRLAYRRRMKQIAGLAIAAMESLDRNYPLDAALTAPSPQAP